MNLRSITTTTAPAAGPRELDGVYRTSWNETEMIAAGATHGYAHGNHGTLTWTLKTGTFSLDFTVPPICHGTFTVSGHAIAIKESKGCGGRVAARWTLSGHRLNLNVTQATDPGDRM